MSTRLASALLFTWLTGMLSACAGDSRVVCDQDMLTGSSTCLPSSSSGGEAVFAASAAAVSWAAVGCTANGCLGAMRCNEDTKQCEPIACSDDRACPVAYACNEQRGRCE